MQWIGWCRGTHTAQRARAYVRIQAHVSKRMFVLYARGVGEAGGTTGDAFDAHRTRGSEVRTRV